MNLKYGTESKSEIVKSASVDENDIYRATNNDRNKPCAHYWDGTDHPETGEHLKSDYEFHKDDECLYAQFSDKENNTYFYVKDSEKTVSEQVNEDRDIAQEQKNDRGR